MRVVAALAGLFWAAPLFAGPAMSAWVQGMPITFEDCKSRAADALRAETYGDWRAYGNGWIGSRSDVTAAVSCVAGNHETVVHIVTAGGDTQGAMTRLAALIREGRSSPPRPPSIDGSYYPYGNRSSSPASIQQNDARLVIDNGAGSRAEGSFEDGKIVVKSWGVSGRLSEGGCRIDWSNDTWWRRIPCAAAMIEDEEAAAPPGCSVTGTWYYSGDRKQPPSTITRTASGLRLDNGVGSVSRGRMQDDQVVADDWGVTGQLSENGCRINWSNGTWWRQYR